MLYLAGQKGMAVLEKELDSNISVALHIKVTGKYYFIKYMYVSIELFQESWYTCSYSLSETVDIVTIFLEYFVVWYIQVLSISMSSYM